MVHAACLSVCLSVTPFSLWCNHRIIIKFSGIITNDGSGVYAIGLIQRSKVMVTDVKSQLNRFRTLTPVWIHIWWFNDVQSLVLLRRGALLLSKVIRQISKAWSDIEEVRYCFSRSSVKFQGHTGQKSPILTRIESSRSCNSSLH